MEERLQKLIAMSGICSRRKAEQMISDGKVTVNGLVSHIGDKADISKDMISVDGVPLHKEKLVYILFNKPRGYVTTVEDEFGRQTVMDFFKDYPIRIYPVGRLDKDSEGLLLLTNDGEFMQKAIHPSHEVNKKYDVVVQGNVVGIANKLSNMREIDGEFIQKADATLLTSNGKTARLEIIIHEGKNRQIRRMCESCGCKVLSLKRIEEAGILLGDLKIGKWRHLTSSEIQSIKGN